MKKILITGGAGFIGSEIVNQLYDAGGWDITVLDLLTEQIHGKEPEESYLYKKILGKCNFVQGNVTDYNTIFPLVSEAEYIIHLAAETGTGQSMYQINQYNNTNIMGTSNLLQAMSSLGEKNNVKQIILSSSRSVYGEGKYNCEHCGTVYPNNRRKEDLAKGDFNMYCPICGDKLNLVSTSEDSEIRPYSLYAYTKSAQEQMISLMCPTMNVEFTIFRFQNVYGVGQSLKNPYTGILSIFSSLMLENKPINVFEDGMESRDFINVFDVAKGVIASIGNEKAFGEIINLGSGIGTTVLEITEYLKAAYKSSSLINITGDFRIGDIAHNIADIRKAKRLLDFEVSVKLEDGLSDFCAWVVGQEHDNSGYEHSLQEMEKAGLFIRK